MPTYVIQQYDKDNYLVWFYKQKETKKCVTWN